MRDILLAQCHDRGKRGENRVTVVGPAAAVQLVTLDDRLPRAETRAPAGHLRLLVQVPIEQHRSRRTARNLDEQQRRAPGQADDLELHADDRLTAAPVGGQLHGLLDVAVRLPVRIEVRRLARDADVLRQARDDVAIPERGYELLGLVRVHVAFGSCRARKEYQVPNLDRSR